MILKYSQSSDGISDKNMSILFVSPNHIANRIVHPSVQYAELS